jgi:uncharacterized protein
MTYEEKRSIHGSEIYLLHTRGQSKSDKTIGGFAARYGRYSTDPGLGFREILMPDAFKKVLATGPDVVALFNHDPNLVLGRTNYQNGENFGTLQLQNKREGLFYVVQTPDTQVGADVRTSIMRGDIRGSSFSFAVTPTDVEWQYRDEDEFDAELQQQQQQDDMDEQTQEELASMRAFMRSTHNGVVTIRKIHNIGGLFDVSPVTFPAYQSSTAAARSVMNIPADCPREFRSKIIAYRADFNSTDFHNRRRLRRLLANS